MDEREYKRIIRRFNKIWTRNKEWMGYHLQTLYTPGESVEGWVKAVGVTLLTCGLSYCVYIYLSFAFGLTMGRRFIRDSKIKQSEELIEECNERYSNVELAFSFKEVGGIHKADRCLVIKYK